MGTLFEELAYSQTSLGELILRRRRDPAKNIDIYEVKLNDEFLMSSLFTEGEIELARLGLVALPATQQLDVVVGGLGLGHTACAALEDERVASLIVVEALGDVIDWHQRGLVPLGNPLTSDPRCRLIEGNFFELVRDEGFDPHQPMRQFDAILVDIDHSPSMTLHESHKQFYSREGLTELTRFIKQGGVFALWSNEPPEEDFCEILEEVFDSWDAHVVSFPSLHRDRDASNTVYVAQMGD